MAYPANNLADIRPDLAKQFICLYNKDGSVSDKKAEEISIGSNLKAGWNCDKPELGHSPYKAVVNGRTRPRGSGCPTCSGRRTETGINDLATTHPHYACLLIRVYNKDGSVSDKTAKNVSFGSNLYGDWECSKPELGHAPYKAVISYQIHAKGCPTCYGQRVEAGINDLATTHPYYASQLICIYNKDGSVSDKTAQEITAGSHSYGEWVCDKSELGHSSYKAVVKSRTKVNGSGCPTCANQRVEAGINDLATTHPYYASQLICIYNKDGSVSDKTAQEITAGSGLYGKWECDNTELGHVPYKAVIKSRTRVTTIGSGCPLCATGKTENSFRESFSDQVKNNFLTVRMPLKRELFTSGMIQIDMLCEDLNLVIEYDGTWAHGGVFNANKERTIEDCIARDTDSTLALLKKGYKVIRIREWDLREKLPFLELPEKYLSNLYQVTYKSYGKNRDYIDDLVKQIIEEKRDWFCASVSNNDEPY